MTSHNRRLQFVRYPSDAKEFPHFCPGVSGKWPTCRPDVSGRRIGRFAGRDFSALVNVARSATESARAYRQSQYTDVHEPGDLHHQLGSCGASFRISRVDKPAAHGLPHACADLFRVLGISVSGMGRAVLATLEVSGWPDSEGSHGHDRDSIPAFKRRYQSWLSRCCSFLFFAICH